MYTVFFFSRLFLVHLRIETTFSQVSQPSLTANVFMEHRLTLYSQKN